MGTFISRWPAPYTECIISYLPGLVDLCLLRYAETWEASLTIWIGGTPPERIPVLFLGTHTVVRTQTVLVFLPDLLGLGRFLITQYFTNSPLPHPTPIPHGKFYLKNIYIYLVLRNMYTLISGMKRNFLTLLLSESSKYFHFFRVENGNHQHRLLYLTRGCLEDRFHPVFYSCF